MRKTKTCQTYLSILQSFSATMLYQNIILIQDDASYYKVEIKICTSPNELRDAEKYWFPWRKVTQMFDRSPQMRVPWFHRNYRWQAEPNQQSFWVIAIRATKSTENVCSLQYSGEFSNQRNYCWRRKPNQQSFHIRKV